MDLSPSTFSNLADDEPDNADVSSGTDCDAADAEPPVHDDDANGEGDASDVLLQILLPMLTL